MKKILLVLAMTLTGFLSEAQNTITKAAYPSSSWNMDTIGYQGVTNETTVRSADSKVISIPTNYILVIAGQMQTRAETPVVNNLRVLGSMDNATWHNVVLSTAATTVAGAGVVSKGQNVAYTGSQPTHTPGAYSTTGWLNNGTVTSSGDTSAIVFGTHPVAGNMIPFSITISQPTYSYYKLAWTFLGSANTTGKHSSLYARYYLRKPY